MLQKGKIRNEFKVMKIPKQLSLGVSGVFTCLLSIGARKKRVMSLRKSQEKDEEAFKSLWWEYQGCESAVGVGGGNLAGKIFLGEETKKACV